MGIKTILYYTKDYNKFFTLPLNFKQTRDSN